MKKIMTIQFLACVIGIACFSGMACSMEKLEEPADKTAIPEAAEEQEIDAMIKNWQEQETVPEELPEEPAAVAPEAAPPEPIASEGSLSSEEYVRLSWEASSHRDLARLNELVDGCVAAYGVQAKVLQAELVGFPERGQEKNYQELNDVGTCLFIKAEAVMNSGETEEAIRQFQRIIEEYPWAQAWDPRGWFWSVAEKSQASIDVLTGKAEEDFVQRTEKVELIKPQIAAKGTVNIVDYSKYGEFQNVGTDKYFYRMKDPDGLSAAIGEGIYPNTGSIYDNPRYKIVKEEGRLEGSHWDFVRTHDLEA
ncbi:MAG TPA: hypothetical protein PKV41_05370, partial [Candidatus Omnitrophota bacterium]|nr:hypothetical protein [Candidatus Omnitrophota bacterium]